MVIKSEGEYKAQEMLLGMKYNSITHSFQTVDAVTFKVTDFDADTLEQLSYEEVHERINDKIWKGIRSIHDEQKHN